MHTFGPPPPCCGQRPAGPALRCAYGAVRVLGAAGGAESVKIRPSEIAGFLLGENIPLVAEGATL